MMLKVANDLHSVSFRSRATVTMTPQGWQEFTAGIAQRNMAAGITGRILHDGHEFLQILEGPMTAVLNMMRLILHDSRHSSIMPFGVRPRQMRMFTDWSAWFDPAGTALGRHLSQLGYMNLRDSDSIDAFWRNIRTCTEDPQNCPWRRHAI